MSFLPDYLITSETLARPDPITTHFFTPEPTHVMSRDKYGSTISTFRDNTWDFSMLPGKQQFIFSNVLHDILAPELAKPYIEELKLIMFRVIYLLDIGSMQTVADIWMRAKKFIKFAARGSYNLNEALDKSEYIDSIINDPKLNKIQVGFHLRQISGLYSVFHKISVLDDEFKLAPSEYIFKYLRQLEAEYPLQTQQTPVIPTRILSSRISSCFGYIDQYLKFQNQIETLFEIRQTLVEKNLKKGISSEKWLAECVIQEFKEELLKPEYSELRATYDIDNYETLRHIIGKVRLPIRELIHAFSGMRRDECNAIAMDGFRLKEIGRDKISVIRSYTTKMARDSGYFADWVTTPELEHVFHAAKSLNRILLRCVYKIAPEEVDESLVPLFLSTDSNSGKSWGTGGLYDFPTVKATLRTYDKHPINLDPEIVVTAEDIAEIYAIDPLASPESLKPAIELGKPFRFQTHMYRRSLAVYTARSGLVSLPTLKKQLKHVAIQNSAYYGNDATYAKNFILPKSEDKIFDSAVISQRGFIKEFQDEQTEGQVARLYDEIISADEIVFGGMGSQIQKQKISGTLPTILTDREKTKKHVKQGRLRFTETPLGGCMAIEVCNKVAFSSITTCIGCNSSVFNNRTVPLLHKTREEYEKRLDIYGTGTPYGKQLERDIKDIDRTLKMRSKLIEMIDIEDEMA